MPSADRLPAFLCWPARCDPASGTSSTLMEGITNNAARDSPRSAAVISPSKRAWTHARYDAQLVRALILGRARNGDRPLDLVGGRSWLPIGRQPARPRTRQQGVVEVTVGRVARGVRSAVDVVPQALALLVHLGKRESHGADRPVPDDNLREVIVLLVRERRLVLLPPNFSMRCTGPGMYLAFVSETRSRLRRKTSSRKEAGASRSV